MESVNSQSNTTQASSRIGGGSFVAGSSSSRSSSNRKRNLNEPVIIDPKHSVPFELLYAQLTNDGRVSSSDYLAQSRLALQTSNVEDYDQTSER